MVAPGCLGAVQEAPAALVVPVAMREALVEREAHSS